MKTLTCIICPSGCRISVDEENDFAVSGNRCPRGKFYAVSEVKSPVRLVTSTIPARGLAEDRLPVRTDKAVPKSMIFEVLAEIKKCSLSNPVKMGDIIIENVCQTGANVVASSSLDRVGPDLKPDRTGLKLHRRA